jgi:hypothetical protein
MFHHLRNLTSEIRRRLRRVAPATAAVDPRP